MGYQIRYGNERQLRNLKKSISCISMIIGTMLLVLLAAVSGRLPMGRQSILHVLLPGDPAVTAAALSDLTRDLRAGGSVSAELKDFCADIIEGAGFDTNR